VNFKDRYVVLYTRKKKGGHRKPRRVPMGDKLQDILHRLHERRHKKLPFVFWHHYWSRKQGLWVEGPYLERKRFMKTLCAKAGVRYFRFHALRHFGASLLDQANRPIGEIQRLLGHECRTTTEIYLHSLGDSEREAIMVLESELNEKSHTETRKDLGSCLSP
jgi:integrase